MFQTAVASANNESDVQHVTSTQTGTQAIYQSHWLFLGLAVLFTILAVLIVTVTFHGYWHLGRKVTMSPIELAKAFNGPLLRNEDSNADVRILVKRCGDHLVRYGVVNDGFVHASRAQGHFQTMGFGEARQSTHLEVADEGVVREPVKGWRFWGHI